MTDTVSMADLDRWVRAFAELVAENKDSLTGLDAAIGDGDHGANMDRGMRAAVTAIEESGPATARELFTKLGMTVVSSVGGASGPLFGTMFLRIGAALGDGTEISLAQLATGLRAGLDGVRARGKAEPGDKTMLDALAPAVAALETAAATGTAKDEALRSALSAAEGGRDATIAMLARKGRASYLGERSVGHQDPGATTTALLVAAAVRALS
ncbi:dihydroxyacetone kinase subunit DhaL [Jatrophihabitans sp.]|jgi:dihydroxyacetone kinase-like protein|uniref:dihydroxyacetone kinase subunit DhaL n=1 Tax=Jatrophihabitans sp. TaxID=1932789 RepID=UPI0038CDC504